MKPEEYREGMAVRANGTKGIANGIELCNGGKYVVHVAFPMRECQWRVPIEQVEVEK
jgi:hypothetical protein